MIINGFEANKMQFKNPLLCLQTKLNEPLTPLNVLNVKHRVQPAIRMLNIDLKLEYCLSLITSITQCDAHEILIHVCRNTT